MADASTILDSVESALAALYPAIPVRQRKGRPQAGAGRSADVGWTPGDPSTCFILSIDEREVVDRRATFEHVETAYPVHVAYVRPAIPGSWDEDDDARDKREAILDSLYKPRLTGLSTVFDVRVRAGPPYEVAGGGTMTATSWVYDITAIRSRPN